MFDEQNMQQLSTWTIQLDGGELTSIDDIDEQYDITGERVPPGSGLNITFGTNLTVNFFKVDMDNSTIFCGTPSVPKAANFSIRVYGEY